MAGKPKKRVMMIALAVVAVGAVGVSTLQVGYALSKGNDMPIDYASIQSVITNFNKGAELKVTFVAQPGLDKNTLTIENITNADIIINHFCEEMLSSGWIDSYPHEEPVTLAPSERLSFHIEKERQELDKKLPPRVVTMQGQVVNGRVVLLGT